MQLVHHTIPSSTKKESSRMASNNVTAVPATSIKRKERDEDESSDEGSDVVGSASARMKW